MALNVNTSSGSSGSFEPLSQGSHAARLVQIIDLGIQKDDYQGVITERPKVMLTFEVPGELIEYKGEQKPKWVSVELTVSFNEKAKLPSFVKSLDPSFKEGREFDLSSLLGKTALLNIGRTSGGKAKIINSSPLPKGLNIEDTDTKLLSFDIENQDEEVLSSLPEFLQTKIAAAINNPNSVM